MNATFTLTLKRIVLILLLGGCFNAPAETRSGENAGVDASQKGPAPEPSGKLSFQTDLFTGRFGYQVPLELAPGRHGGAPSLGLSYSSAAENSWCGVGWELDPGFIQRETKRGVPVAWTNGAPLKAYDDAKGFVFSLNGQGASLVRVTNNVYRAEIEGGFLRFMLLTNVNQWQVTDTSGNQYYFGLTNNSRMSNGKTGWSSNAWTGTYRWALARVESVLGDTTDYTYTNIAGTLYPLKVSYNGHTSGLANTNTVDFILGTRSDVKVSYLSGYRVELNRRLDAVVHKAAGQIVWSNRLNYAQSTNTTRSLLKTVVHYGTNLTSSLPPTSFGYSVQGFGFLALTYWTNLSIPGGSLNYYHISASTGTRTVADLFDMDGDGLPDRVFQTNALPVTQLWVQHNNGSGFDNPKSFGPDSVQNYYDSTVGSQTTSNQYEWTALNSTSMRLLDINGDSLPDRVADPLESYFSSSGVPYSYPYTNLFVQLNSSTNWLSTADVKWTNVVFTNFVTGDATVTAYRAVEGGRVAMLDMNGDGLPDRLLAKQYGPFTNYFVQFNTGAGFTGTNTWGPLSYETSTPGTYGGAVDSASLRLLDLNGDGLPDRMMYPTNATGTPASTNTFYWVQFNNGAGFESPSVWDGLYGTYSDVLHNHSPEGGVISDNDERAYRDMNGDGLPDRIFRYWQYGNPNHVVTNWLVQINTGTNFAFPAFYGPHSSQGLPTSDYTGVAGALARLVDINGDGIPDHVMEDKQLGTYNRLAVELGKGPMPDLITVISNGIGGVITASYLPSTQYDNRESTNATARQLLPFPIYTVATVSVSDGIYPSNNTSYAYEGGFWNASRREFNGFARVRATDPIGGSTLHWFHQNGGRDYAGSGEYQDTSANLGKKGLTYRVDTFGTNGQLYATTLNLVADADLGDGGHFAFVSQTLGLDYPGSTNAYRATAQQFAYDLNNGNLTNQIQLGEVLSVNATTHGFTDTGNDSVYQFTTFATLANTDILDKPQRTWLSGDAGGTGILRESLFEYDGDTGNLTQKRDRICEGGYATNSFGYDSYHNQTSHTDAAGIVTTTVFDSATHTFPVEQTVAGSFTSTMSYDVRSGQLLTATDAKGLVSASSYDVFLRPVETKVSTTPNGAASQWVARYDYRLGMAGGTSTNSIRLRTVDDVDATNGHESWTYADGLGRTIQTRTEAETNGFRVVDTVYDKRGAVWFETLPYFSTGTNFTKPTGTLLGTRRTYDAAARLTNVTAAVNGSFSAGILGSTTPTTGDSTSSPVGSLTLAYNDGNDPWVTIRTDEENKVTKFKLDAFGRTNQIVEPGNYTTTLGFDLAGSLTNITDHANNQIDYAYNDLGLLVAMADPDLGVWQYRRDFAGRLREQEDAKGQLVSFSYDDPLGRLSRREAYAKGGIFMYGVTNTYDSNSGDSGYTVYPGQLHQTADREGWQKNGYDVRNRVLKTVRYLAKTGQSYTNQISYDNADRAIGLAYPNGGPTLTNLFDLGGNLSQVKQVGGSNTVFWTARGWNALGQSLGANFGNGVSTTNDYYANSKRLKRVVTFKGATKQQDLTYTFDKVSNLKGITDAVYTNTASAGLSSLVYDDLHRLTSLTRPAISQTHTFSFDAIGNLTVNGEAGVATYTYGTHLPHAVKSANGIKYAYDANGNMLVRGTQRMDYDAENRLMFVLTTTSTNTFGYAGDGTRLWKQGPMNLQVWIGGNYEEKNGQVLFHILASGQTVCTFDSTGTNVFEYYHGDHLRSTSVLTDQSGNRVQHHEYSAFGRDRFTESSTAFPISRRYTSQVLDEDTGLYYYNARYYDPQLARFVQPDKVIQNLSDPQALNRYSYVRNNPLRYTDPTGHAWVDYLPFRANYLEISGQLRLDDKVRARTDYGSYKEYIQAQHVGTVTAGDLGTVSAVAHGAGNLADTYANFAPDLATAGLKTAGVLGVRAATSRMGEAPGMFSKLEGKLAGVFGRGAQNFTQELDISENLARAHLRRAVGTGEGQAHHLIPWQLREHPLIKRAAESGFNINGANNGIRLDETIHLGSHAKYNAAVERKLDTILTASPKISPQDAAKAVQGYADQLRAGIQRTESKLQ